MIPESKTLAPLRKQTTISQSVSVSGYGFWSGQDIELKFQPASANSGIVFVRTDLPGHPRIPAIIQNRINGPRRTTLVAEGCPVEMVEHVLAALAGLNIDNCEIHVNRAEMPGDDGSSKAFSDALNQTEVIELDAERETIRVTSTTRVGDENSWIQAEPVEQDQYELAYHLEYACPSIGTQTYQTHVTPEIFATEIAPARTFVLLEEAQELQKKGLGQRVRYQDILVFGPQGPIDNQVRFENECARHKLLDMIGDFSLSGFDLIGKFTASRSGHRLNSQLVFALLQQIGHTNSIRKSA